MRPPAYVGVSHVICFSCGDCWCSLPWVNRGPGFLVLIWAYGSSVPAVPSAHSPVCSRYFVIAKMQLVLSTGQTAGCAGHREVRLGVECTLRMERSALGRCPGRAPRLARLPDPRGQRVDCSTWNTSRQPWLLPTFIVVGHRGPAVSAGVVGPLQATLALPAPSSLFHVEHCAVRT